MPGPPELGPVLPVRVGDTWVAVPATAAEEILGWETPMLLPRAPRWVPGLVPVRGAALPLFHLPPFLGLPDPADAQPHRIVVVRAAGLRVGIVATKVMGVRTPEASEVQESSIAVGQLDRYAVAELHGDGGVVCVLDLPRLLRDARIRPAE